MLTEDYDVSFIECITGQLFFVPIYFEKLMHKQFS